MFNNKILKYKKTILLRKNNKNSEESDDMYRKLTESYFYR